MKSLNPFEVHFLGTHLIEASAGTGKTYNIESLYIRAIVEAHYSVDQILVVTYTEAATKELRDRLMRRLTQSVEALEGKAFENDTFLSQLPQQIDDHSAAIKKLEQAIRSFDEAAVYTIHGFCGQALRDHAFESGAAFDAELIGDDAEIVGELVDDYWRNWVKEASASKLKRPLLQFLLDKGYTPERLTKELASFWGKPYLEVRPEPVSLNQFDEIISELRDLYETMRQIWNEEKEQIRSLLLSDPMSGRRFQERYLQSWMPLMDEWLDLNFLPIERFDKFSRFSQSYVNDSLKKTSEDKGINPPQHSFFKKVDEYIKKSELLNSYETHFKRKLFADLAEKIESRKAELQVYSYDDLLVHLKKALFDNERGAAFRRKLRETYPLALVDEFQDTDPIQYQIFNSIYGGAEQAALFMIGDPKQSIYSFRGADIFSYLRAKQEVSTDKIFSLAHNYRSVPALIEGINTLFSLNENPFILEDIAYQPVQPGRDTSDCLTLDGEEATPIQIRQWPFDVQEGALNKKTANNLTALDTAALIQNLLVKARDGAAMIGNGQLKAGDIAVLVGTHRQATMIRQALQQHGIKSVTHSKANVFKSDEARELSVVLKAIIEPGDESLITTALSTPLFDFDAEELLSLKDDETKWAQKMAQFSRWHEQWQLNGFASMFRTLMQDEKVAQTLMQYEEGERKITNLVHLSELIQQEQQSGKAGMHTLYKWLIKKRNADHKEIEEEQLRLESDENLVKVVTMHHSKGLEYPVVFCPFLWNSVKKRDDGAPIRYHDSNEKSVEYLDLGGKDDPDRPQKRYQKEKEALAEGVRLAYVAVTRAEYCCIINCIPAKKAAYSPLGSLLLGTNQSLENLANSIFPDQDGDDTIVANFQIAIDSLAAHDAIESSQIPTRFNPKKKALQQVDVGKLLARSFQRAVPLPEGDTLSSFSSLTHSQLHDKEFDLMAYYDEPLNRAEEQAQTEQMTIFSFPKGPGPGTAVHHIFENIDFTDSSSWNEIIPEQLGNQDIDSKWRNIVHQMLQTTVNKPLLPNHPGLSLAAIDPAEMIAEMEFYFTNGQISLSDILQIIRGRTVEASAIDGFSRVGFMKGFIDLTFSYEDKFYILDYKTNYLGSNIDDYRHDELQSEIEEALYDVQYHLYLVALHRFLDQKLANYNYHDDIGGALYLFLRGINESGREGIFYDRPDAERIKELDQYLGR